MSRRSGLQKEVLSLYRRALRLVATKPERTQPKFRAFIRYTFHQNVLSVSPRNVTAIEYLMRKGRRQIEQMEDPAVRDCWFGKDVQDWAAQNPGRKREK